MNAGVNAFGQILSNYQAALYLFEAKSIPPELAHDVFAPVLEACAGAPGLEELAAEAMGEPAEAGGRDPVVDERSRIAITHSRLITRQASLSVPDEVAARLRDLASGSRSAGALFKLLLTRFAPTAVLSRD